VKTTEKRYGEELKRVRTCLGISQEELADRAGVHTSYISQLERGIKSPTLGVMTQIAKALGCHAWAMVKIAENDRSSS
jgi:transcriptional regulator with XRE-family HTH domain